MGSATRQYSKEEIIEKYQRHIDNYENIIVELEIFENSVYVKEKNIKTYAKAKSYLKDRKRRQKYEIDYES